MRVGFGCGADNAAMPGVIGGGAAETFHVNGPRLSRGPLHPANPQVVPE